MGRRQAMGGASKTVAVKLLATHLATNPVYRRMFVDEARLTMMLTHSNIVQVFDVGQHEGRSYLVMEWVDGLDLSRLAASMRERGETLELHVIAHVIGEVLRGLAYAHGLTAGESSSTIVHRDISPHNVLISVSGEVKISDFGVARLATEETSGVHVRGKLRYMPPEQLRGKSRHPTTDLFAVGAMMQELLDGVRFRAGCERDELIAQVIAGEIPPLEREGVPMELRALRDGLLAGARDDRIQSANEALELLRRWPGYRNAADELADLVRGRSGVTAPRTGLEVDCSDEVLEPTDEPTYREGGASNTDGSKLGRADQPTRSQVESVTGEASRAWWTPLRAAAIVILLAAGLGFGYAGWPGSVRATESDLVHAIPPEPMLAATAPVSAPELAPSPAPSPAPAPEPSPELESAAQPAPADASAREAKRSDRATPAHVEFAAHEFFFVWIKVDGRKYALEPVVKLELAPGRHKVWLRESDSDPWTAAGRIDVDADARYRVSLEKPAKVRLQRL